MQLRSRVLSWLTWTIALVLSTAVIGPAGVAGATGASKPLFGCFGGEIPSFPFCNLVQFTWMQGFDDPATPDALAGSVY